MDQATIQKHPGMGTGQSMKTALKRNENMTMYPRFGFAVTMLVVLILLLAPPVSRAHSEGEPLGGILKPVLADLSGVGVLAATLAIDIPGHDQLFIAAGHVSNQRSVEIDASDLFQIGSQTKTFTAAAILLLERDGKLSLTDPVSKYVKGVTGSPNVTIEQLLTHTSGIGDSIVLFDPPALRPDYHVSLEDHLLLGRVSGQQFEAGESWHYNNLAFVVLGRVVEIVSGQALNQFVHERLLQPLGMDSTWLGALESYPEALMARGYFIEEMSGDINDSTMPDLSWASSAGDMISNLTDMLKWSNAMLDKKNPTGLTLDDFRRIVVPTGSQGNMKHYGLGIMGRNLNGHELWGHGGNIHGYVSLTMIDPETSIIVVLMTSLVDYPENLLPALESVVSMAFHMSLLQMQADKDRVIR
jgi:CubicO group peptidase (beta-lactamase class C family)